ncbi:hypothetical protein [Paenibacillus guangzhouensis]|uniref:hypothetical protein n=1 Tax=Paenibacillus guangzhouensis TaxID=1473112 RepID=UPI0012674D91|nr:hypothetical protein [Paenibacillus guangzhouensis]
MEISVDYGMLLWSMIAVAAVLVGYFYLQSPVGVPIRTAVIASLQPHRDDEPSYAQSMVLRLGCIRRKIPSRKPRKKPTDDEAQSAVGVQRRTERTPIGGIINDLMAIAYRIRIQHIAHRTLSTYA